VEQQIRLAQVSDGGGVQRTVHAQEQFVWTVRHQQRLAIARQRVPARSRCVTVELEDDRLARLGDLGPGGSGRPHGAHLLDEARWPAHQGTKSQHLDRAGGLARR
jgi:hypothetical protein